MGHPPASIFIFLGFSINNTIYPANKCENRVDAIAPWFHLCLQSCGPGFESQAHHLPFLNLYYWNCIEKITKINKKRLGLAHFFKKRGRVWPIWKEKYWLRKIVNFCQIVFCFGFSRLNLLLARWQSPFRDRAARTEEMTVNERKRLFRFEWVNGSVRLKH